MTTRATRVPGGYRVTGTKTPVEAADQSGVLLVTAVDDDGPVQLLVTAALEGVEIVPLSSVDLVRRFAEVVFDDVFVPQAAVVVSGEAAAAEVERQVQTALVLQCAETCGALDRVMEFTVEYLGDRFSFGRPLASYQALKHRVADLKMWLEACHGTTAAAVEAVGAGRGDGGELARVAKVYVGDRAPEIVQDCVQLHGGIGVTWEHDLHLYLRRVTLNRSMYGPPSLHRKWLAAMLGMAATENGRSGQMAGAAT